MDDLLTNLLLGWILGLLIFISMRLADIIDLLKHDVRQAKSNHNQGAIDPDDETV